MTNTCFICGEDNPVVLEEHHIIPRRHGGSDNEENLVTLCANCHKAVEKIYDDEFYKQIGFYSPDKPTPENATFEDYVTMVNAFIESRVVKDPNASTATAEVYKEFQNFAEANSYRAIPDRAMFGRALSSSNKIDAQTRQIRSDGGRDRVYDGIDLVF